MNVTSTNPQAHRKYELCLGENNESKGLYVFFGQAALDIRGCNIRSFDYSQT